MELGISKQQINKKLKDLCKLNNVKKSLPNDSLFMICNQILIDALNSYKSMYKVKRNKKYQEKIKTLSSLHKNLQKGKLAQTEINDIIEYGVKMYKSLRDNYGKIR